MTTDPLVLRDDQGAITHLTLNSPKNLNALSDEMLAALQAEFDALEGTPTQKVIVLKGFW